MDQKVLPLLLDQYHEHMQKIYDLGMKIRKEIKNEGEDFSLMNPDMKNTYQEYLKENLFYLFQYYIKMAIIEEKSIEQDPDFIKDIQNIKLCHYTSFEALNSIINNKTLKFNSLSNMNDRSEGEILFGVVENLINRNNQSPEDAKTKLIQTTREQIFNDVFSFSLTTEYDDAPQWERYTDKDTSVCLVSSIHKIGMLPHIQSNICHFNYGPIYYTHNTIPKDFDYVLYCNLYRTDVNSKNKGDMFEDLPTNCAFIKCSSFKNEREVRLVVERNTSQSDDYFTRKISDTLKPYILFNLDKYCQKFNRNNNFFESFFDEIIIGPQSQITEENLRRYLKEHNINNIRVTKSNSKLKR